jgi:selenocysteine lyase/cysteine desulfurase
VSFTVDGHDSTDVSTGLRAVGTNTSVSTPSHHHFDGRSQPPMVSASTHAHDSDEDLDRLIEVVRGTSR